MRLICPSCGAQYEVDESVIPDGGRDVQCSNCGHAWFQRSAGQLRAETEEAEARAADMAGRAGPSPTGAAAAAPAAAVAAAVPGEVAPEPSAPWADHDEEPAAPGDEPASAMPEWPEAADEPAAEPTGPRPRRTLDDAVRNVLREEAERETRARQAEGEPIESQPDLGLAAGVAAGAAGSAPEPDRAAKIGGDAQDFDEDALVPRAARRELLPDIEEINSTLRATSERGNEAAAYDAPETLARRRSGFRMGFSTAILAAVVLLAIYVLAPVVARSVPALEPALSSYVGAVDAGRLWLDGQMRSLTQSLQGATQD